jgi:alpha-tubulin suppressor-like RCC1 family protein
MRYLGGFITASYNPLKVPNAPTIDTVTPGNSEVSVAFTAPSNVGGAVITSYTVLASNGTTATGTSSPIVVTGLTNGVSYTFQVFATNLYGPSAFSATSGSVTPVESGFLFSFGLNSRGELGTNNTISRSSPVQVGSDNTWRKISTGTRWTLAVKINGTLWSWGSGGAALGLNDGITYRSSPVQVGALTNWSSVGTSTQDSSSFAIKTDGTLWSWGGNANGSLGQNNTINLSSPVQVGSLTNWAEVNGGTNRIVALKTDGTLWAWGSINMLTGGVIASTSSPVQIGSSTWKAIGPGFGTVGLISTDGTLWLTGSNNYGQLGLGDTTYRNSPTQVGALTNWDKISCNRINSQGTTAAIKTDGTLWSWGSNNIGQLGQNNVFVNLSSPTQVGSLTNWKNIQIANEFCLSVKTDGTLWTWGQNDQGQLGFGNISNRSSPTQVGSRTSWVNISNGESHSIALG